MTMTEQLIKKAKQSPCRHRISCIGINKKGEVVGSAINKPRFWHKYGGLHAEHNLIIRYKTQLHTIIICRIGNSGNLLPVNPCVKCARLAKKMNIRIVSIGDYCGGNHNG